MACISCGRGFHYECTQSPCCCDGEQATSFSTDDDSTEEKEIGTSAGRKRAALQYPIDSSAPCEWQQLGNCGGGKQPIIGCLDGLQKHRHHGPVKDTSRNEHGNLHRICYACHNLWHGKNDRIYDEDVYDKMPHAPRELNKEEHVLLVVKGLDRKVIMQALYNV